jgi:hypothetical protein
MASFDVESDPEALPGGIHVRQGPRPSSRPTAPRERRPRRVALDPRGPAALRRTRRLTAARRRQEPGGENGEQELRDLRVDLPDGWWQGAECCLECCLFRNA